MKSLDITQASDTLGDYVRQLASEPLLVIDRGQLVAALVPLDEDGAMSFALAGDPRFLDIIERGRAEGRAGLGVPATDVRRSLGLS